MSSKIYDENGHWVEERGRIKGAIRRTFRLFPQVRDTLNKARVELPPLPLKDGGEGKKIRVRYRCAMCGELFSSKNVQVDHINPVVPFYTTLEDMLYDDIVRGICCSIDNLQVLCSTPMKQNDGKHSCHKKKTDEENFLRREIRKLIESGELQLNCAEDYRDLKTTVIPQLKERYIKYIEDKNNKKSKKQKKAI